MSDLLPPVSPRLYELAESLEPLRDGGSMSASYIEMSALELLDLAEAARVIEAITLAEDRASRALFALAGAFHKRCATDCRIEASDARILRLALGSCAKYLTDLEARLKGAGEGAAIVWWPV